VLNRYEGSIMITKCPKCNAEFENVGKWSIKKFCSRKCANSKERPQELRNRISQKLIGRPTGRILSIAAKKKLNDSIRNFWNAVPFDQLKWDTQRKRVIKEQEGKCNRCKIDNWLGEKLILEVDHKDGNNKNNDRINLEGLCPNCHSLTKNWRGRNNKTHNLRTVTDEELLNAIKDSPSICQALWKVGLAAKGTNYTRARKLLNGSQVLTVA